MSRETSTTPWPFFRSARTGSNLSKDPIIFSFLPEKLDSQDKLRAPWESRQKLGSPDVGHPSVQCQSASSGMHAIGDLDTTDVQRVFSFNPPCREDRGGAIYLEFVFGVVKYFDPRLVSRESYWVRDTIIQVGKFPLWSKWPGEELSLGDHCKIHLARLRRGPQLLEWAHRA